VVGDYLIVARWKWDNDNEVFTAVLDDGERLHVVFIYTWEIEAVMKALGATYSHSKHLGERLLVEAIFKNAKPRLWVHGLVRPHVVGAKVVGTTEEHADRLPKVQAPWKKPGGNQKEPQPQAVPVPNPIIAERTFRL
jgi:hypothetical protein